MLTGLVFFFYFLVGLAIVHFFVKPLVRFFLKAKAIFVPPESGSLPLFEVKARKKERTTGTPLPSIGGTTWSRTKR